MTLNKVDVGDTISMFGAVFRVVTKYPNWKSVPQSEGREEWMQLAKRMIGTDVENEPFVVVERADSNDVYMMPEREVLRAIQELKTVLGEKNDGKEILPAGRR